MKKTVLFRSGDAKKLPYLVRYTLFSCKWFSIKLHHILISDEDCLHDHPWAFISIGLWGSYLEYRQWDPQILRDFRNKAQYTVATETHRRYRAPWIIYRPANSIHRLELKKPVWTLVITFKKVRQWGFWTRKGWIPWFKYSPQERC